MNWAFKGTVMDYSDKTINDTIDKLICYALTVDYQATAKKGQHTVNPNYKSGCPYDEPGELVKSFSKDHPEISHSTEKHWRRRFK